MTEKWSYLNDLISEYDAGSCEALIVALYVARKVLALDEVSLPELPSWLSSEIRRIVRLADQGLPIQTVSNSGLEDHGETVRKFSAILKRDGVTF